jgi:C4-dicarboxylate-specific signal transduction histidine kinase
MKIIQLSAQDMTEKIENERMKEKMHNQLLQSEKMAILGRMAGNLAHEFNNPMGIIYGKIGMISRHLNHNELSANIIEKHIFSIARSVERVSLLIKRLNYFNNSNSSEFTHIPVKEFWEDIKNHYQNQITTKKIKLLEQIEDTPPFYGVKSEIAYVISSLLDNAIDACSQFPNPWIKIKIYIETIFLFAISDGGPDNCPDVLENLYSLFTTKENNKCRGLGLYLQKNCS